MSLTKQKEVQAVSVQPEKPDMELPKRKEIRLKNYDYSQTNIYYVTVCTHNREKLFGKIVGSPLPDIIDWFKTMTTNKYIRGVKAGLYPPFDKHIWQRNYFEHIIRCDQDYEETWRYIDENPLKHFLKKGNML